MTTRRPKISQLALFLPPPSSCRSFYALSFQPWEQESVPVRFFVLIANPSARETGNALCAWCESVGSACNSLQFSLKFWTSRHILGLLRFLGKRSWYPALVSVPWYPDPDQSRVSTTNISTLVPSIINYTLSRGCSHFHPRGVSRFHDDNFSSIHSGVLSHVPRGNACKKSNMSFQY